jgi:hypothetical protein
VRRQGDDQLTGERVASCGIMKIGYLKDHGKGEMHDREP